MQCFTKALASRSWPSQCRIARRSLCSSQTPIHKIPLTDPLPGFESSASSTSSSSRKPLPSRPSDGAKSIQITTLSNGLRVVTVPKFGQFCTVGACIDSGSRYEVPYLSGISHFVQNLAFTGSQKYADQEAIRLKLEDHGGLIDCQMTRDTFLYASSIERNGMDTALEIIGDAVLRPNFSDEVMEFARMSVQYQNEDVERSPHQDELMMEAIHSAAWANNTLGLPKFCPSDNVERITRDHLIEYLSSHHTPERMVIAGVGVDHDEFVKSAEKHFVVDKPVWGESKQRKAAVIDESISQYTGGFYSRTKDLSNVGLSQSEFPELSHLSIGLKSCSHQDMEDFIPFCVMNSLMGGGNSFSSGGPGKGMYTRLYTHALNRHHFLYGCIAQNHAYLDSGMFCITANSHPGKLRETAGVIAREFNRLAGPIQDEELGRAKKQLTSMLMMNLESRPIEWEDVARQVLTQGTRHDPEHYIQLINDVTKDDMHRIAVKMLKSKPSVACVGNLDRLPDYEEIVSWLKTDFEGENSSRAGVFV